MYLRTIHPDQTAPEHGAFARRPSRPARGQPSWAPDAAARLMAAVRSAGRAVLALVLVGCCLLAINLRAASADAVRGEFGGDLTFLAQCYQPPADPRESNYYFDLWAGESLRRLVAGSGLVDNHTLFVNSHGMGRRTSKGKRYALFPHAARLRPGQKTPYYSAGDLARVMGPKAAVQIHNIIIGGCNEDGSFRSSDFRAHFPNATNITHMAAGKLGCQPMLLQALMTESRNIQSIYESPVHRAGQAARFLTTTRPRKRAVRFDPYLAELFLPGSRTPYKQQVAGRELLDPTGAPLPDLELLMADAFITP